MKLLIVAAMTALASGCATLTNDPTVPVTLSFSNATSGHCDLRNKRGFWSTSIPNTVSVRRSDDELHYRCTVSDGQIVSGTIPSTIGVKLVGSVILDFGITDSITDKHREYPASYVIPVPQPE